MSYYPITTVEEWDKLPNIQRAMDWLPVEVNKLGYDGKWRKETTYVEDIIFSVSHLTPYKVRAEVRVHRQEFQKIMMCYWKDTQCHLYELSGVEFENGEVWPAKWQLDNNTGAFRIIGCGKTLGIQGNFSGHIPACMKLVDGEYKWDSSYQSDKISHYQFTNPFI